MKNLLILATIILFISCNNCNNDDCPSNALFKYNLVNINGENLFTIPNNSYNINSIKVISYRNGKVINIANGITKKNSIYFSILKSIDSVVVTYNENEKDVFAIKNLVKKSVECCEDIVESFDISVNGQDICSQCDNNITYKVVK